MKITNIWMSKKWQRMEKLTSAFVKDLMKYADQIAIDYGRMGLTTYLTVTDSRGIALDVGADTNTSFGFVEVHNVLRIEAGANHSYVCAPLIRKHMINICAIYLLLEKHGYAHKVIVDNDQNKELSLDIMGEAQTELMNLQLI